MLTPVIIILIGLILLFLFTDKANIITADSSPPAKANIGSNIAEEELVLKRATYSVTKRPLPSETPNVPGLARSLCRRFYMLTPATPIPIPTKRAKHNLGRRNSNKVIFEYLSPPPNKVSKTFKTEILY